jgi:hypothetical protein
MCFTDTGRNCDNRSDSWILYNQVTAYLGCIGCLACHYIDLGNAYDSFFNFIYSYSSDYYDSYKDNPDELLQERCGVQISRNFPN